MASSSQPTGIEMTYRQHPIDAALTQTIKTALQAVFGFAAATELPELAKALPLEQRRLEKIFSDNERKLWPAIRGHTEGSCINLWDWCYLVATALTRLQQANETNPTFKRVVEEIRQSARQDPIEGVSNEAASKAIFACLCVLTGMGKVDAQEQLSDEGPRGVPMLMHYMQGSDPLGIVVELNDRLYQAFEGVQAQARLMDRFDPESNPDEELKLHLVDAALLRDFAKVTFELVDSLYLHLTFNERTRTLRIYRHPSLCLAYLRNVETNANTPAQLAPYVSRLFSDRICQSNREMFQEVLVTYRLLFGQCSAARNLLRDLVRPKDDPFLKECAAPTWGWAFSRRILEPRLKSSTVKQYSLELWKATSGDPVIRLFRNRVIYLQSLTEPSGTRTGSLRTLLCDRRNPEAKTMRWCTAAAILISCLSVTVAIVFGVLANHQKAK